MKEKMDMESKANHDVNGGTKETIYIKDEIARCENIEDLKSYVFPMLQSQQEEWQRKIAEILTENRYTKTRLAELCGVSRVTVDKWCKGAIPKNREMFLRIGMAAGYDAEQMNQLLQRYGRYPALYSKSLEDCICLFIIGQGYGQETLGRYRYVLQRIRENITRDDTEAEDITTLRFDESLSDVQDEDALEAFITQNSAVFASAYHKFYAYVKICISANAGPGSIFELAEVQRWSSSLRQCVSAIRQKKWYPTRNKIISLGLHLAMDHDQIDAMLELAHMEPLCAKNPFESVIMFILDDASLNDLLDTSVEDYDPDALVTRARQILSELDMPEAAVFLSELRENDDV